MTRIKGIRVQQIDPINLPWPFSLTHYTSHGQHATPHHQASGLWRAQSSSYHPANHRLALGRDPTFWQERAHSVIWLGTLPDDSQGSLPLCFWLKKHWGGFSRLPRTPSMGLSRRGRTQRWPTIIGGMMCFLTSSLMIDFGLTWSGELNGFGWWIEWRLTIWPSCLYSKWGFWTRRLPTIIYTKWCKWSGMEPLWCSISYPGY